MLFFLFWPFEYFCSVRLFCLFCFFFLFFLVRMHRTPYIHVWVVPGHPSHTPYSPMWSVAVMCRPQHPCQSICPPHTLAKIMTCGLSVPPLVLFCVCWVLTHPTATLRTHTYPPESLLAPLRLRAHMCLFWGNFPAIHGWESHPTIPFLCLFVLFACALVLVHPTTPIQTHIHPYARVHTRPHPRLLWNICTSVNLIKL